MRRKVRVANEEKGFDPSTWGLAQGVLKVPSRAVVKARGRVYEACSDFAYGDSWEGAPFYDEADVVRKFRRLVKPLAPQSPRWESQMDRMVEQVLSIEQISDANALTRTLGMTAV